MRLLWLALAGKVVLRMSAAAIRIRPGIKSRNLRLGIVSLPCIVLRRAESEKTVAHRQSERREKKYTPRRFVSFASKLSRDSWTQFVLPGVAGGSMRSLFGGAHRVSTRYCRGTDCVQV